MPVMISLLRAVNLGGHNKVRMDALRLLYESLGLRDVQTYIQSGNVIFRTAARDNGRLALRIEQAIERSFGFRSSIVVRSIAELREVIQRNPFAARTGMDPRRLLVTFLATEPTPEAREKTAAIRTEPEEIRLDGRHLYIYFPNGMGRSKLSPTLLEKAVGAIGTGRNWNTVTRLLELAEKLEIR
jgi:uncharacterized protein (DUF1697 family)